jgi:hypothetical protein
MIPGESGGSLRTESATGMEKLVWESEMARVVFSVGNSGRKRHPGRFHFDRIPNFRIGPHRSQSASNPT